MHRSNSKITMLRAPSHDRTTLDRTTISTTSIWTARPGHLVAKIKSEQRNRVEAHLLAQARREDELLENFLAKKEEEMEATTKKEQDVAATTAAAEKVRAAKV